jgi:hypothetical protein
MPNTLLALITAAAAVLLGAVTARLTRRRRAVRASHDRMPAPDDQRSSRGSRSILAETTAPEGTRVVLFEDTWHRHVLRSHGELEPHLQDVVDTIASPDHREDDAWPHRERFFKRDVGPSRWLMVVVSSELAPARIVTALGYKHGRSPQGWTP